MFIVHNIFEQKLRMRAMVLRLHTSFGLSSNESCFPKETTVPNNK